MTSTLDVSTINGAEVEGLVVYNTSNVSSNETSVSPGFYSWDGSSWKRFYSEGYSKHFQQTSVVRSNNIRTTYTLPGLDQNVVAPYSGTYQIYVIGHYAATNPPNNGYPAVGYASISLEIDNVKVKESFVTSTSKKTPGTFAALAQQTTLIYTVDLNAGQTYNFKVRGTEWRVINYDTSSLQVIASGRYGFFGTPTELYNGNVGKDGINGNADDYNDGQRAILAITLLHQF